MNIIPPFLVLVALAATPLRVRAMEDREDENASGRDETKQNSEEAADQASKAAAASDTENGFVGGDDNNSLSAVPRQEKSAFGVDDDFSNEVDFDLENLREKISEAQNVAESLVATLRHF